jgi:adenylate kinase family enzyme
MRRILVIGSAGAGKSTLARRLSHALELPLIEMDRIYWRAGWTEPSKAEWRQSIAELVAAPAWVMDGNYGGTFDLRMPRADTVVWLDLPRLTCMRRVLLRIIVGYGRAREGLPAGCPERFDMGFLRFVWDFQVQHRPQIVAGLEQFGSHPELFQLANNRDVAGLVQKLKSA